MAIRRPPTTFSDSITGADLASDIAISTTGNIATTGSGVITSPIIQTDSIKDDSGTRVLASDSGSAWNWGSGLPSGSIVQVQYTQYTGHALMSSISAETFYVLCNGTAGSGTEILNVTVTPKISNSKFLIEAQWMGEFDSATQAHNHTFAFYRGSTILKASGASGGIQVGWITFPYETNNDSTPNGAFLRYFDSPSISAGTATTYKLGYRQHNESNAGVHTNRVVGTTDGSGYERGISSISVTEIAP